MRSCHFYSPNLMQIERFHGLELSEEHPFDKPHSNALCTHPELSKGNPYAICTAEQNQVDCSVYSPNHVEIIRSLSTAQESIVLSKTRDKFGFTRYIIHKLGWDESGSNPKIEELYSMRAQDIDPESDPLETLLALYESVVDDTPDTNKMHEKTKHHPSVVTKAITKTYGENVTSPAPSYFKHLADTTVESVL